MTHKYLFDTNVLAALARNPAGPVALRIAEVGEALLCTSVIVACEVHYGLVKRASPRLRARMTAILETLDILNLPGGIETHYGQIRAYLDSIGGPIGPNDLLIAAHARAAGLVVVTGNMREFSRVPDLRVENWIDTGTH